MMQTTRNPTSRLFLAAAFLAAALLALPSIAAAQAARAEVSVGSKSKKKKKASSLFDEKTIKKKKKAKKKRDPDELVKGEFDFEKLEQLSFDERARRLQARKSRARRKMISDMEDLMARRGSRYANAASIFFRLAETWWDETHYQYLLQRANYNKKLKAYDAGTLSVKPTEPVENYQKSIEYYEKVLSQFPNYKRIDEVVYRLGKAALSQGKALGDRVLSNKGVQYLNQLVQRYAQSRYIPNAHLALAEHFFDVNNLTLAKMNYERIVQNFKNSPMYNYALYKLGWVYFNLREFRRTIETFQAVVREISKQGGKAIGFRDQALKDLIPAYAELENGWPEAKAYFLKVEGEKKMWKALLRLANIYVANDKDDLAIALFGHFIDQKPTDARCVDWWEQIIDIYIKLEEFAGIEQAVRKFLAFTDERTSPWISANKGNAEAIDKARDMGERLLLFMSNRFHQTAQKKEEQQKDPEGARPFYIKAAKDYAEFVRRYPNSPKAYIVNFYYAEILFDHIKDYKTANKQYKRVIALDRKGEYVEDAALGVIYSVEELMKQTHACYKDDKWKHDPTCPLLLDPAVGEGTKVEKTKTKHEVTAEDVKNANVPKKRQELHPLEADYVMAADKYVELMEALKKEKGAKWMKKKNRGQNVPGIMYLAAATYYERGQYPKAIERLEKVYKYDQGRLESEIAVKTIIDVYARQKNWPLIEKWARRMVKRGKRKLRLFKVKDLRKYIAVAVGEQAREMAERKDFDGAHRKYDTILREFRRDEPELAAISLFNKATIYEIQKEEKKAIQTYEAVVKQFKKSKVAPEAMFNIGMIYEAQTQFKDASDSFLKMAKIRKNSDAAQALINSGAILKALRQYSDAAKVYGNFIKLAKGLKEGPKEDITRLKALIPDAHLEVGKVHEKDGNLKKAIKAYGLVAKKMKDRPELRIEAISRSMAFMHESDTAKFKAATAKYEALSDKKKAKKKPPKKKSKNRKKVTKLIKQIKAIWDAEPKARKGMAVYYYAQALFMGAEYVYDDFANLSLSDVKNMKGLKPMLEKQAKLLKAAEKGYFGVIDTTAAGLGRAFAAAAAFKIGLLYYRFKEDLFNAPLPKKIEKLSDMGYTDVEDRYRETIEKIAAPIEEQALVALRHAINVAHNLGVYNKWSREAGEYAAKVNPSEYPTVEKDPNLPKATTALNPNKTTDPATSAAFITRVRRGKFTVSFKPKSIKTKEKKAAKRQYN